MRRFKFFITISVLSAFVLWIGGFIIFDAYIRNYKIDRKTKTDAIAVLTGGRNRIAEALEMYNIGLSHQLIISGVGHNVTLEQLEKQNNTQIRAGQGDIMLGDQAKNTIENAIEVNEIIRRKNIRSLRLITSFYHMPRSEQEIWARNHDITIIPHPVFSPYVSEKWWKSWRSFLLISSEYHKFVYVYVKNFLLQFIERD